MIGSETKEKRSHLCQAKGYLAIQGPSQKGKLRPICHHPNWIHLIEILEMKRKRAEEVPRWPYPVDSILLGDTWWKYESRRGHVHSGVAKSGERSYATVPSFRDTWGGTQQNA